METTIYKKNVEKIQFHKNAFALLAFLAMLSNLILLALLIQKKERVIIAPPTIEKEFWIEGNRISPSYLEQFGIFLSQLLLNKSAQSAPLQNRLILRYIHPENLKNFEKVLVEEQKEMLQKNLTYLFFPDNIALIPEKKQLVLQGERIAYVGEEEFLKETQKYRLSFSFYQGRLLLKSLVKEESAT